VLAGGTGARLGGADKASLDLSGRPLLDWVLDATDGAVEVVVVGDPAPTRRPVRFVREEPPGGGPAAGLLAGRDALTAPVGAVLVLACDMPRVDAATVARLRAAAAGRDGAALVGPDGRRALAMVLDLARLDAVRPTRGEAHGMALRRLLAPLDLVAVDAVGDEHRDVDTWVDLARLQERTALARPPAAEESGAVNLHDWIDELCDVLDLEDVEVDEGLLADLTRVAARNVEHLAAPVTAYLLGVAAGSREARPDQVEQMAARAQALAEAWDRPSGTPDPEESDVELPDDSAVDHRGERYEDDRSEELPDVLADVPVEDPADALAQDRV
jgi:molybdopterin-guanine dinucleotide biosynthesis protein A